MQTGHLLNNFNTRGPIDPTIFAAKVSGGGGYNKVNMTKTIKTGYLFKVGTWQATDLCQISNNWQNLMYSTPRQLRMSILYYFPAISLQKST